jgi:hypothetical protein
MDTILIFPPIPLWHEKKSLFLKVIGQIVMVFKS